ADLGAELAKQFARQGIDVLPKTKVTRVSTTESGAHVGVDGTGGARTLDAAMVLVAVGRTPNTEGLSLDELRIRIDRGHIVVGPTMETSVSGVWAIGDLVGPLLLAHAAS